MITERTYRVLCHCNVVASTVVNTAFELKVGHESLKHAFKRALQDGFLEEMDTDYYQTTPEGRTEIRLFKEAQQRTVPAPKINKFDGVYIPSASYQRNQGNKHIQSRGF